MLKLGMEEDVPIESKLISRRIKKAQESVEAQNFAARKHLIEYDDVMNKQREAIYGWRHQLLEKVDQREKILDIVTRHSAIVPRCAVSSENASEHLGSSESRNGYQQPVRSPRQ